MNPLTEKRAQIQIQSLKNNTPYTITNMQLKQQQCELTNDSSSPFRAERKSHHHIFKPISPKGSHNKSSVARSRHQKHATSIRVYNPNSRNNSSSIQHTNNNNTSLSPLTKKGKEDDNTINKSRAESKSIPKKQQYSSCRSGANVKAKSSLGLNGTTNQTINQKQTDGNNELDQTYIYQELMSLKSEYKTLKQSYSQLLNEKKNKQVEQDQLLSECSQYKMAFEKAKAQISYAESELHRVKKECYRLLEQKSYKMKKMEETLQEKQLMIGYLRNQLSKENNSSFANNCNNMNLGSFTPNLNCNFLQSTTPIFRNEDFQSFDKMFGQRPMFNNNFNHDSFGNNISYIAGSHNNAGLSENDRSKFVLSTISDQTDGPSRGKNLSLISQDSLRFSKDPKSLQMDNFMFPDSNVPTLEARSKDISTNLANKCLEGLAPIGCCTFQLKNSRQDTLVAKPGPDYERIETRAYKENKKMNRKKLQINTDESNYQSNGQGGNGCCESQAPNLQCENCHSIETKQTKKKDSTNPTKRKKKLTLAQEDDLSSRSMDKKTEGCVLSSKRCRV